MSSWLPIASSTNGSGAAWWQVVTGVLGIPIAFFGILGGYRLSQRTRLETHKLQLEIEKEEGARRATPNAHAPPAGVISPGLVAVGDIVTRFVIFMLLEAAWGYLSYFVYPLVSYMMYRYNLHDSYLLADAGLSYRSLVIEIPSLVIFVLVGWPLLLDIARDTGLSRQQLFRWPRRRRMH